jgi:L1 cell adhesion molecule
VEVTDFGLAKLLSLGESEVFVGGKVAVKWVAIECLNTPIFTHASDVWAFGVTVWEILTFGQSPYQGIVPTQLRNYLERGNRLEQPNNCNADLYKTLLQCAVL